MPAAAVVLLDVPLSPIYGRGVALGVRAWAGRHAHWRLVTRISLPAQAASWGPIAGAISMLADDVGSVLPAGMRAPVVNVSERVLSDARPRAVPDNRAVGVLAARHLLEVGCSRFLFVGLAGHGYGIRRGEGFRAALADAGQRCALVDVRSALAPLPDLAAAAAGRGPLGVFACSDHLAAAVLAALRDAGLRIPADARVIGADDDELHCELCDPPLSSVDPDPQAVGMAAARMLAALMAGGPPPATPVLVPPRGVVARASTAASPADGDPAVGAALALLRAKPGPRLRVADLVAAAGVSRRTLELRFRARRGETLLAAIRRARLDAARALLAEDVAGIADIARRCGWGDAKRFARDFRAAFGSTPQAWRRLRG